MPFEKGKSGNPGGRPKKDNKAAMLARQHAEKAINAYVRVLDDAEAKHSDKISAATSLLDRGFGKPTEYVDLDADHAVNGQMDHTGLPELMDRITADIQRGRAKDDMPPSGEA